MKGLVGLLLLGCVCTGCGGGATAPEPEEVCERMMECDPDLPLEQCLEQMEAMRSIMRAASFSAYVDCMVERMCAGEGEEDEWMLECLREAGEKAPPGAVAGFVRAACERYVACGDYPGTVQECVEALMNQGGDYVTMLGVFNDQILSCVENCLAGVECEELDVAYEICMFDCDLVFPGSDPCDQGEYVDGECVCETGWAGELCDECAEGWELDPDHRCIEKCRADSCSGHGVCEETWSELFCTCDPGYTGDHCEECAAGWVRSDGWCVPEGADLCQSVDTCEDDGRECTRTVCEGGYCQHPDLADFTPCPGSDACDSLYFCFLGDCLAGPPQKDTDGDGYGDLSCSTGGWDCDDEDASVHPGAEGPAGSASCTDGVDNDCDELIDEDDPSCWGEVCSPQGWCWDHPRPAGVGFTGVWASSASDVWLVGRQGAILHFDESGWSGQWDLDAYDFLAVSGCGPDRIWATTRWGEIWHYDGVGWSSQKPGGSDDLNDVWCLDDGSPEGRAWIVGEEGLIYHFDGSAWQRMTSPVVTELNGVWASGASDVWAVGEEGVILHDSGAGWSQVDNASTDPLNTAWGSGEGEVWLVGEGYRLIYEEGNLTVDSEGTVFDMLGIHGLPGPPGPTGQDFIIVGGSHSDGVLMRRDRDSWDAPLAYWDDLPIFRDVWMLNAEEAWVVGDAGTLLHLEGTRWSGERELVTVSDMCAFKEPGSNLPSELWAAGGEDALFFDGGRWRNSYLYLGGVRGLWCAGYNDVWAAGDDGQIEQWVGNRWLRHPRVARDQLLGISGVIHEDGTREVWAVGQWGTRIRFDGEVWLDESIENSYDDLTGVTAWKQDGVGHALAVSDDGYIYHWDGSSWSRQMAGTFDHLTAVDGDGSGQAWIVGDSQKVYHWQDGTITPVTGPDFPYNLEDVWVNSAADVWIVGSGDIFHYDGATWTEEGYNGIVTVTAIPSEAAWTGTRDGGILRKNNGG